MYYIEFADGTRGKASSAQIAGIHAHLAKVPVTQLKILETGEVAPEADWRIVLEIAGYPTICSTCTKFIEDECALGMDIRRWTKGCLHHINV